MAKDLQQTKNSFKLIGKVARIDADRAYRQETMPSGQRQGQEYRALGFQVKTSEPNSVRVEMFDFEPEQIFMWNSEKRKKDKNYKGDRVDYAEWVEKQDELREQGYAVLQTRLGLDYGEDGKIVSQGLPSYVASKEISEKLDNGDSVIVEGEIRYSEFKDQQGNMKKKATYTIKKLFKLNKEVDFDAENFEEVTYYEQEFVYVDADHDREAKKVFVTGRTIDYRGNFIDSQFVVDYSDGDAGMKKLAEAFVKKIGFGDFLKVRGEIQNRVVYNEDEGEDNEQSDEDEMLSLLGGKSKPKHAQKFVSRDYINEMQITGVEVWDKKVYKEEDFVKDEFIEDKTEKKNPLDDELGGKASKGKSPFDVDTDDDEFGDDLPF